jgi:hypothetical protein
MSQFNQSVKEIIAENKDFLKLYSQTRCEIEYRLLKAYQNFFRRIREKKKGKKIKVGFPRFKSQDRYDSLTYPQDNGSFSIETHQELKNRTRNEQTYPIKVWLSSDLEVGDRGLAISEIKYSNLSDPTQDRVFKIEGDGRCFVSNVNAKSTSELKNSFRSEATEEMTTLSFNYDGLQIRSHESFTISIFQEIILRAEDSFYKWFNRPTLYSTLNLVKDFSEIDKNKCDLVTAFNPVHPASKYPESTFMRKTSSSSWDIFKPFFPKNGYIIQWKLKCHK